MSPEKLAIMMISKESQFLTIFLPGGLDDIKDDTNKK